jgi:hypothetical protein
MAADFPSQSALDDEGLLEAHPDFNPRALMEDELVEFTKSMETIDTVPAHQVVGAGV